MSAKAAKVSATKRRDAYWNAFRDALVTGYTQVDDYRVEEREYYRSGFADGLRAINRIQRRKA